MRRFCPDHLMAVPRETCRDCGKRAAPRPWIIPHGDGRGHEIHLCNLCARVARALYEDPTDGAWFAPVWIVDPRTRLDEVDWESTFSEGPVTMTATDEILWQQLRVSERTIIVDTRDGDPLGTVYTGDRLETLHRAGVMPGSLARACDELNIREGHDRFQVVLLPPV